MDSHVFQPWQIEELVRFLNAHFESESPWSLGHRLAHMGIITTTCGSTSCLDFDDHVGLWWELCRFNVMFAGTWAEIMDATLRRTKGTGQTLSFFYEFSRVCAREADPSYSMIKPEVLQSYGIDRNGLREAVRLGISQRVIGSGAKRKYVDIEEECRIFMSALMLDKDQDARSARAKIATAEPSPWP